MAFSARLLPARLRFQGAMTQTQAQQSAKQLLNAHAKSVSTTTTSATFQDAPVADDVKPLFEPLKIGRIELAHRVVMAPLTRCRALGTIPQPQAAEYYSQRATPGGLLLTEATCIMPEGHGYPNTPGIDTKEHVEAWKPIVKAVKDKGAFFFLQLWHVGRASHPDYQPNGAAPVSSSAIAVSEAWPVYTPKGGPFAHPTPRALETEEIPAIVQQYAVAARNAIEAGFDGVEIHSANGYLLDQFIRDGINKRTDAYGGSIENRTRLTLEVAKAVTEAVGADRTGIRLSPFQTFLDASDSTPYATFTYLVEKLNDLGLAYIHMVEPRVQGNENVEAYTDSLLPFKTVSKVPFIAAGGHNRATGAEAVRTGHADAVAYGRWFISNPDLPKRLAIDAPLTKYDRNSFYIPDQVKGYTDYPTLEQEQAAASAAK